MNTRQFLIKLNSRVALAAVVLVAIVVVLGYLGWHKHQTDNRRVQQQTDLGVFDASSLPVAFLSEYGRLQGDISQQKNLVAKYGTASFIKSYQPAKKGANDPLLCTTKTLSAVSTIVVQPVNANSISTLDLRFSDGSPAMAEVQVNSQIDGLKINSINRVSCPDSHVSEKQTVIPGGPNKPTQVITP